MDTNETLVKLLDGFQHPQNVKLCSPAQLVAIGEHNLAEYERLASGNPERIERIKALTSRVLAKIQPAVLEQHGKVNEATLRQQLLQSFKREETEAWIKITQDGLNELGLDPGQIQTIGLWLKTLPERHVDAIMEIIGTSYLLPEENAPQIIDVLTEMAREAEDKRQQGVDQGNRTARRPR